jgi:hypothetical protein
MLSNRKEFEKDQGFQFFSRMISSISFNGSGEGEEENFNEEQIVNSEEIDDSEMQEEVIFAQMLPILACFKALINSSTDCEKKAHLFF